MAAEGSSWGEIELATGVTRAAITHVYDRHDVELRPYLRRAS